MKSKSYWDRAIWWRGVKYEGLRCGKPFTPALARVWHYQTDISDGYGGFEWITWYWDGQRWLSPTRVFMPLSEATRKILENLYDGIEKTCRELSQHNLEKIQEWLKN